MRDYRVGMILVAGEYKYLVREMYVEGMSIVHLNTSSPTYWTFNDIHLEFNYISTALCEPNDTL
jgi:hypothetical protein